MNLKNLLLYTLILFTPLIVQGQIHQSKKNITLSFQSNELQFDTLSILPSSVKLFQINGSLIDSNTYQIRGVEATIYILNNFPKVDSFRVVYQAFPYNLTSIYSHKSVPIIPKDSIDHGFSIQLPKLEQNSNSLFGMNDLQKNGNISRGISVGNAQDMSVASNLNLQLAGSLSEELDILASISDQNIPIQPDGNTQQIQEFDRVFIQLKHQKGNLTAGDFIIKRPNSYFLNYQKKVQGARVEIDVFDKDSTDRSLNVYAGAALSKGKYAVNQLSTIEGNQGPYKLVGNNLESYIIVIAGSEKVYIDGKQIKRGQSNDYLIDYNTAEITFTAHQIITKDKRIKVEFEYTDRNYARSTVQTGLDYESKKVKIHAHFYDESDLKNQSLDQTLSTEEISLLSTVGDNLNAAISSTVDSVGYFNDRVLYKKVDSLGFSDVYVYSIHPDSAYYQLNFSNVGQGNGNYIQVQSAANGRVYKWIAPIGGIMQGTHEPIAKLVSPKKKQMVSLGMEYQLLKQTFIRTDFAFSNQDINLFSEKDQNDNQGIAARFSIINTTKFGKDKLWALKSSGNFEFEQANFNPIERYRSVEFNRNWNLPVIEQLNQQFSKLNFHLSHKNFGYNAYQIGHFKYGNQQALQNKLNGKIRNKNWTSAYLVSLTNNGQQDSIHSNFLRHRLDINRKIGSIKIGVKEDGETNQYFQGIKDSLSLGSYKFQAFDAYIESLDTSRVYFKINAHQRKDYFAQAGQYKHATTANEVKGEMNVLKGKKQTVKAVFTYRQLEVVDTLLSKHHSEESSAARLEHRLKLWKGALSAISFYEAGSGMEVKKEYAYLEVAAGQGVYSWSDYNGNNVKELDEFEISAFTDEANYIRIYIPTNEYIKTYGNQFSTIIKLTPSKIWRKDLTPVKKLLANFSNKFNLKIQHKSTDDSWNNILNPFVIEYDSPLLMNLNSTIRNTTYFRRSDPTFGGEFTIYQQHYKNLLSNGFESQNSNAYKLYLRYNFNKALMLSLRAEKSLKAHESEYFASRNYNYNANIIKPELSIQMGKKFRIRVNYKYSEKINFSSVGEASYVHNTGIQFKLNQLEKGSWETQFNYLQVNYNADDNTAIAYELLDGYKNGQNFNWGLTYMRTLANNMQLNFTYNGRKANENEPIHVGSVMLRAFF